MNKNRYSSWGRSRGPRLPEGAYARGRPVHVTTRAARGCPFVSPLAEVIVTLLVEDPHTLAFCLMPDHLHWLLADSRCMVRCIQRLKGRATFYAHQFRHEGELWQRSYYDRVIRSHENLLEVARYIVANPVRAGLVGSVEEYPYQHVFVDRFPC